MIEINTMDKFVLLWYSKVILKLQSPEIKKIFRKLETNSKKRIIIKLYLKFNLMDNVFNG
jgi:hypothetical protein